MRKKGRPKRENQPKVAKGQMVYFIFKFLIYLSFASRMQNGFFKFDFPFNGAI